ncbi:MAG: NUDIX hydrolase [Clostridia bacterium]|nr:NUDIX hydrolase [Clostridia bacterium]
MEQWDIYDKKRQPLGYTKGRSEALSEGEYHLIAFTLIFDRQGEMLLTLRDPEKLRYPNLWGNTGGAVQAGETTRDAIVREVYEETGIEAAPEDFLLLDADFRSSRHSMTDVFLLIVDRPKTIYLQKGETVDSRWVTIRQAERMMEQGLVAAPDAERWPEIKKKALPYLNKTSV